MASLKDQLCTIDRRGFRKEPDSSRPKLIHYVGLDGLFDGLIGPELLKDLKLFKDFKPVAVSDWSFDENCPFCCLRRDTVKEHVFGINKEHLENAPKPLVVKDQIRIIGLEKKAEEFLDVILCRKDVPRLSDPHIPVVAREILQRMISQFAAEYTSKTSSPLPLDGRSHFPLHSDQTRPAPVLPLVATSTSFAEILAGPAQNQNPVLSKLLMSDQDAPLDLTMKNQDGVLDLSLKKNRCSNSSSLPAQSPCLSPAVPTVKCESPDYRAAKAKDLQSTSTLEQFMSKLCPHHQRQIVDAIGFLKTEVKAHASSIVPKATDTTSGIRGKASLNPNSSSVIPEKSHPQLKLPLESTPKDEVLEIPNCVANSGVQKKIPEDAVSPKTSATSGGALDDFSPGFGSNQPLTSSTANSVDGENNRHSDQPPVRMTIKTSNAAAGKKRSCVLGATVSSPSHILEEKQGTPSAKMSSSVKRRGQMIVTPRASQKEVLAHQKDKTAKVFPFPMSFPSNSSARKTVRISSEHQIRDDACREIVDPDIGNCDIVFIDKPITECFKEKRRSLVPRRNARKSTRGHMYSDDIWELKTVRTLAGRGNCPNPMPVLTPLVTPKQILTKPEGLPSVEMPLTGACSETMNQQIPSEELNEHVIPAAADAVEVAASKVDAVEVEMSQTDSGQNKMESVPPSPMNFLVERQETLSDILADHETIKALQLRKESEESVGSPPRESTADNNPESKQVVPDNTGQTATEMQREPLDRHNTEEAEHQLFSDKLLNCEDDSRQNRTVTVNPVEDELEKDKEENQGIQPEIELQCQDAEVTEKSVSTGTAEELAVKGTETEIPEANICIEPVETKSNETECDEPAKPVDEQPTELPPWWTKEDTKTQLPDLSRQTEPVISGSVNGKSVSVSDRSLRSRADRNPTTPDKTSIKSGQNLLNCTVSDPTPSSTVEDEKLENPTLVTNRPSSSETPMIQQVMELCPDPPSTPPSKLPSRTKESPKQKSSLRTQRRIPELSDQSTDLTQSTESKRQLRSASQKTATSTSNIVTSISSPKPSTLILPPAEQLSTLIQFPLSITVPSLRHSDPSISECSKQQEVSETVQSNTEKTQQANAVSEDTQKNKLVCEIETKQTLRSGKVVSDNSKNEKQCLNTEESNSVADPSSIKTENKTEAALTRSKRLLRKNLDVGESASIQMNAPPVEDRLSSVIKDVSVSEKPMRMPLRSETSKSEMPAQSVVQSPPRDGKKSGLRSQKSTPHSSSAADTPKQNDVVTPVRKVPERIAKPNLKPPSGTVTSTTQSLQVPVIAPKQEPPKQTVNKFYRALTGEENQHLITNLNAKYDKMLKGWVQMDKEGQPAAKYKNKSDRQAAIWKSKRRARKPKSSEQQKYSPVQMLFMKGFSLTNICRWFLDSTETKSLVIVKKVNTRLPSETQLCFHSSSTVSGPSQEVFPSLQAERLKKHLKKFAIASPVKSNPKSQKLIAKALDQDANSVKLKERAEFPSSTQNVTKYSAAKASAQKGETQKPAGKSKNPASARILRKYSNIRGKMQGQQTTVRMKGGSKIRDNKKIKSMPATKSAAKSNLNPSLKVKKSVVPVSKKFKESAAKLARRKILTGTKSAKPVPKRAVGAQAGKASKDRVKTRLPKRCSQRLGSPKIPEHQPVDTSKSRIGSKKQSEAEKAEREVNKKKTQTKETAQSTPVESKGKVIAAEMPQKGIDVKASGSPDQIQTRSQRKLEAAVPLCGSPGNPSKRAKKTSQAASPKAANEVDEPKLTRSGALKRSQASSLSCGGAKAATKRSQELLETPAKRTRTK